MKQFFRIVLLCFVLLVPAGCNEELKKEIENLNERIDQLTATRIATLDEQVKGIGTTIAALQELDGQLQAQIAKMPDNDDLKAALEAQRTEIQAAIDALEAYVNGENAKVKQWAEGLFATQEALQKLRSYVDGGDAALKEWAEGLFATIEGLNTLKEYVDAGKTEMEDWVKGSYTTLVMHELLSEVVAGLKSKLDALPDSAGLAEQFAAVDSSMRGWVNGQLAGYWTIAQGEAALAAQKKALEEQLAKVQAQGGDNAKEIADLKARIEELGDALSQMKAELTKAYTQAIADAIRSNNGQISASIAGQIAPLNANVSALQGDVATLSGELATVQAELAKLKTRISSMTYIPTHEDGKARVGYLSGPNYEPISPEPLLLELLIRPAEAAAELVVKKDSLSVSYVSTIKTKAAPVKMQIDSVKCLSEGVLSIYVDASSLPQGFIEGTEGASAIFEVSDSKAGNQITSKLIPLAPEKLPWLAFHSEGNGKTKLSLKCTSGYNTPILYHSRDGKSWEKWDYTELEFSKSEPLYLYGDNPDGFFSSIGYSRFLSSGADFHVEGSVMSLLSKNGQMSEIPCERCFYSLFYNCTNLKSAPELPAKTLAKECYIGMFAGCSSLKTAPGLPAETLAEGCYYSMFEGCTSLETAPALPAKTLAESCYERMFEGCRSLETAPSSLPAATLAKSCYDSMFEGCTGLESAPELPAETLAPNCYERMFYGCTSLETAPELPAKTLAPNCYYRMFYGCTSLETAPALPAETLTMHCYYFMFYGCTSLEIPPELPAKTLEIYCYYRMFYDCTSLKSAPELPVKTLAKNCYTGMFQGCTSLKTAPELPAETLAEGCYSSMFEGCSSLKTAPELPAETLANGCYQSMFEGCSSLKKVTCLATNISATNCVYDWLSGVSSTGEFYGKTEESFWSGKIPSGWTYTKL